MTPNIGQSKVRRNNGYLLAVSDIAISLVLFATSIEKPMDFLSKKLTEGETNYTTMEKLALVLYNKVTFTLF